MKPGYSKRQQRGMRAQDKRGRMSFHPILHTHHHNLGCHTVPERTIKPGYPKRQQRGVRAEDERRKKRPFESSSDSSYSPPPSRVSHSAREDHETRIAQGSAERHESRGRKRKRVKRPFESSPILHTHHRHLG
ncbi:hypothetical protein V1264_000978 [Littorina saxatilis]|uniref:Uncharacterized protein n=1 Tax=Littorina saxatilis TaxID=31220 RepID=A0AAN9C1I9_9CAEN